MRYRHVGRLFLIISSILITLFASIIIPPITARSVPINDGGTQTPISNNPFDNATRWTYYRGLSKCVIYSTLNINITTEKLNKGELFSKTGTLGKAAVGHSLLDVSNGLYKCGDPEWVKSGFVNMGFANMESAAIAMGLSKSAHSSGIYYWDLPNGQNTISIDKFRSAVAFYGNPENYFNDAAQYIQELRAFSAGCLEKSDLGYLETDSLSEEQRESIESKYLYTIKYVNLETGEVETGYYKGKNHTTNIYYRINIDGNSAKDIQAECYNDGKSDWGTTGTLGSLKDSVNSRVDAFATYVNEALAGGIVIPKEGTTSVTATGSGSTCVVEGVGWIVCPVMNFLGDIADGSFAVISSLLSIDSKLVASGDSSGTYIAWQYFRDISNILFVIAFLVIIFSQLTGAGINNYGVKKILPRLVITAILVNLSFYLCQIAVDISEILGHSLNSFIGETIPNQLSLPKSPPTWTENLGKVLAGVAITATVSGLAIAGYLAISVPVLLAALLSLVVTLAILVGRQAAVVILIVISPLAFVAYLLPNTEQWFKKWGNMLIGLLLVYPAISLLYGAGKLAGLIIHSANPDDVLMNIVALGATAIPLIATPSLLKGSMNATGTIGAKLSGWASKANGAVGARVKDSSTLGTTWSDAMAHRSTQRQIKLANRRTRDTRMNRTLNRLGGSGYAERVARRGSALADQEFEQSVSDSMAAQKNMTVVGDEKSGVDGLLQVATGKSFTGAVYSEADRVAAIRTIMKNGNLEQREEIYATSSEAGVSNAAKAAMREGYFARGDHQAFGADLGDQFTLGKVDASALNAGLSEQLTKGKISAATLASDKDVAKRVRDIVKGLDATTKAQVAAQADTAMSLPGTSEKLTSAHREILSEMAGSGHGLVDQYGKPL